MPQRTPRPQAVRTLAPQPAPAGIYASKYTPALGAVICARLAAGESLRSICRANSAMPTEKTVWNWTRAHPRFLEMYVAAVAGARAARLAAWKGRLRAQRRARSKTGRRAWNRGLSTYSAWGAKVVLARVAEGEPLYRICRGPGMPSLGTWYNWMRARPALVAEYRFYKQVALDMLLEAAADSAPLLPTEAASERELRRRERAAFRRCGQLAPRGFADGVMRPLPEEEPWESATRGR